MTKFFAALSMTDAMMAWAPVFAEDAATPAATPATEKMSCSEHKGESCSCGHDHSSASCGDKADGKSCSHGEECKCEKCGCGHDHKGMKADKKAGKKAKKAAPATDTAEKK